MPDVSSPPPSRRVLFPHGVEGCKDGAPFWMACGCRRPEKWDARNASLPALEQRGRKGYFGNQFRKLLSSMCDVAFPGWTAGFRTKNMLHPAKAVATMQDCALHLRNRTPKGYRGSSPSF